MTNVNANTDSLSVFLMPLATIVAKLQAQEERVNGQIAAMRDDICTIRRAVRRIEAWCREVERLEDVREAGHQKVLAMLDGACSRDWGDDSSAGGTKPDTPRREQ